METTVLKPNLATNAEGYLKNLNEWSDDWALAVAAEHQIELTDRHWAILFWLRKKQAEGVPLTIRKVTNSGLADIKEFYQLFPGGPLKVSSKIAGIPKPVSCI